jgi:hypothetical protein
MKNTTAKPADAIGIGGFANVGGRLDIAGGRRLRAV